MPMITGCLRFPDYHPLLPRSLLSRRELVSAIYTPMGTLPWRLFPNLGSGNLFLSRTMPPLWLQSVPPHLCRASLPFWWGPQPPHRPQEHPEPSPSGAP